MYLLDTNIVSALARNPDGAVGSKLAVVDPDLVVTSTVVACEIRFGLANKPDSKNAARSVEFLETMTIVPVEPDVSIEYAKARAWLARRGMGIGANDLLIAAHALTLDATVVTDDSVFAVVPGLKIENWLRETPAERE
jgi:tRNA(fMet)-specific endonuclease VapC